MPLTNDQVVALRTELNTDPRGYGYAAHVATGNVTQLVALLNKPRDGTDGFPAITVNRPFLTGAQVMNAIDVRDFTIPGTVNTNLAGSFLESVFQMMQVPLTESNGTKNQIRRNLDRLVGDTNGSQTRLDALAVQVGSRAQQLFAVQVGDGDVNRALAL